MKSIMLIIAIISMLSPAPKPDCEGGCTTTFVIQRCDGTPAQGVRVTLNLRCQGNSVSQTTDSSGSTTFAYCKADIDAGNVNISNVDPGTSDIGSVDETKSGRDSVVNVRLRCGE
jgi:hypothetical protein